MELRSCIHLHSIQAIKNGHVTKVLNVTRGRPSLLLKKVADLCGSGDVKDLVTFRKFESKDEPDVSDFDDDDDDDVRDGLYPELVGTKTTQSNLNCSKFDRVDEKNSFLDANMTLNQIKRDVKCRNGNECCVKIPVQLRMILALLKRQFILSLFLRKMNLILRSLSFFGKPK